MANGHASNNNKQTNKRTNNKQPTNNGKQQAHIKRFRFILLTGLLVFWFWNLEPRTQNPPGSRLISRFLGQ